MLIGSSVIKYNPLDCQKPELLNKNKVEGNILLCGYSFNFVSGTASIKKVSETAKSLGAAGFIVAVENNYPGIKFDPVPVRIPGILITEVTKTKVSFFFFLPLDYTFVKLSLCLDTVQFLCMKAKM